MEEAKFVMAKRVSPFGWSQLLGAASSDRKTGGSATDAGRTSGRNASVRTQIRSFIFESQILQALSNAVVVLDEQFVIRSWNRAAEALYGWSINEVLGKPADECWQLHFKEDPGASVSRSLETSGQWEGQVFQQHKSGVQMVLDAVLVMQRGPSDGVLKYVFIGKPLTEEHVAVQDSVQAGVKWHQLFDSYPEPIAITVGEHFVYVNSACAALFGATAIDEMIGRSMYEFSLAPYHKLLKRRIELLENGEATKPLESRIRRLDGHVRYVRSYGVPVEYDGQKAAQLVVSDITDKKRALAALERSERRFWALFERAGIGIILSTHDGRILETNPALQKMLDYSADDLREMNYKEITHEEDLGIQAQFYRQIHEGKIDRYRLEKRYLRQDGKLVWGSLTMAVIRDDSGAVEYMIGMVEDISARKKTEAELVAAQSKAEEMTLLKSSFLTNMSHEIRTPLTGIIGFAAILEDEVHEEQKELVQLIEQSGQRLLQTLNAILDLSTLESGTMQLKPQRLDIIDEVLTRVHYLEPKARAKGLYLELAPGPKKLFATLDRDSLDRVLSNLISNAIKFTRQGGVTVLIEQKNRDLIIKVRDTGIGISEPFMPHLFEAFRQESTGMTRTYEGTGLGLTITQRLINFLGGKINVASALGEGSEFTITFSDVVLEADSRGRAAGRKQDDGSVGRGRPRVLVLEDNQDARRLLEKFLEGGYDVALAGEEHLALELAREQLFDVVLMDINLGGGRTGVDALRALRHLSGYEQIPVVALTAYAVTGDRERFLSHGFNGYLGKPLTKQELYDVIANVLDT
ncbi:MAG: PAS domain S-box protein [Bacteroidota bacterium]